MHRGVGGPHRRGSMICSLASLYLSLSLSALSGSLSLFIFSLCSLCDSFASLTHIVIVQLLLVVVEVTSCSLTVIFLVRCCLWRSRTMASGSCRVREIFQLSFGTFALPSSPVLAERSPFLLFHRFQPPSPPCRPRRYPPPRLCPLLPPLCGPPLHRPPHPWVLMPRARELLCS